MLNQNSLKKIKETVEEFFKKMTFEVEIKILPQKDQTIPINIKTSEPQILIGERGQTLTEIQHLLKAILKRQIEEPFFIDLDISDYKKKKIDYLKEMARAAADEVALSKKEKQLPSMPAYERRIIHLELAARTNVTTESIGQEPERRVVVRPYP
ncbi:MAG: protein jag [Candidatus Nealsonbacteria bacterium]